jgi:hypothetical protein
MNSIKLFVELFMDLNLLDIIKDPKNLIAKDSLDFFQNLSHIY